MQVEEQNQPVTIPKISPWADSDKSKSKRGVKRPGAGRKPNLAKRLASVLKPMSAAEILHEVDVPGVFRDIFKNGSRPLKLQAVNPLWDRALGKPKQDVSVSGGLVHAHTRDPFLASLPKEALEALARSYIKGWINLFIVVAAFIGGIVWTIGKEISVLDKRTTKIEIAR